MEIRTQPNFGTDPDSVASVDINQKLAVTHATRITVLQMNQNLATVFPERGLWIMRQVLIVEDQPDVVIGIIREAASADHVCKLAGSFDDFVEALDEIIPELIIVQTELIGQSAVDCLLHLSNMKWDGHILLTCKQDVHHLREMEVLAKSFNLSRVLTWQSPLESDRLVQLLSAISGSESSI